MKRLYLRAAGLIIGCILALTVPVVTWAQELKPAAQQLKPAAQQHKPAAQQLKPAAQGLTPAELRFHIEKVKADQKAGDFDAAYRRLNWLLLMDGGSAKRSRAYQQTLLDLRQSKPFTFGAGLSILPSTNLRRNSSESLLHTDIGSISLEDPNTDNSGIGLALSLTGSATHAYAPGKEIYSALSFSPRIYDDADLSSGYLRLSVGHKWLLAGKRFGLSYLYDQAFYKTTETGRTPDWSSHGLRLSSTYRLRSEDIFSAALTVSNRRSEDESYRYRDGRTTRLSAQYRQAVSRKRHLTYSATLTQADLERGGLSYQSAKLGLSYDHQTETGFIWGIGAAMTWRDYQEAFSDYISDTRADRERALSIRLSHRDFKLWGQTPRLTCTYTDQLSNIALYQYDAVDCRIGLHYSF